MGPSYQRPNKERRRGVSGACGSSWAGRRVRLGQRGTGVRAERGRESEGSLGRAGCEWSEGGLCHAGRLGHGREGEEQGWVDGWLWAGVSHAHPLKRPTSSSVNPKPGTSSLGHVPYVQCQQPMCHVRASSANGPCATSVRPVLTAHPRCPRTDPPRARAHAGGIYAPRARAHASALTPVRARETARVGSDTIL